jgi:hypothetical protein
VKNRNVVDFSYAPPSSWTNIGLKDDFYKTIIREDGSLLYGFKSVSSTSWHFRRVYEFSIRAAHGPEKRVQATESARFPCVVTTLDFAKATLTMKTFAHLRDGRRTDVVLWEIRTHSDTTAFLTGLTVNIYDRERMFAARSSLPARVIFATPNTAKADFEFSDDASTSLLENESIPGPGDAAFVSVPYRLITTHTDGFRPCSAFGTEPTVLQPGQTLQGAIIVPQNHQDVDGLDLAWAERAYLEAKDEWNRLPIFKLHFQVPDVDIMAMLEACGRNILQAREIKDGLPVFQVGPTVYRGLWVVDGHFLLEAGHYMGYGADAYTGVDTLLKRVQVDGSIVVFKFHTKETGISLLTLVRQCELMGDDQRLGELWPIIQNGVAYIERLRTEAYALPVDSPCYKLLPMSFGDGGLGGKRGEYTTVFWILTGLAGVAKAAGRLGYVDDEIRFRKDFEALLQDFRAIAARDMKNLDDGTPYLPMCMPGSGDHVWIPDFPAQVPDFLHLSPGSGTWALCHAIYPGEVFKADDPLVRNLLHLYDRIDDREGIPACTGWIPYQSLWSYHASFAAHAWLYAGRGDKAIDYLYAFANHAAPTRVWREEQSYTDSEEGQLVGEMPHNWASAEFIRLVRHLIVFERGNGLELFAGLPAAWRKKGDIVQFVRTPTRFGPVTLRLETNEARAFMLDLEFDPGGKLKPETVKAKLPCSALRDRTVSLKADSGGWILFPMVVKIHLEGIWQD